MNLQRFKQNLAKNLIQQSSSVDDKDGIANSNADMELNDLLKSFEEHTSYQAVQTSQSAGFEDRMSKELDEIWQSGEQ